MKLVSIYKHVSPSGKVYVGQAVNYKRRWGSNGEHYMNKKKDGSYIQQSFARAIDKYGWNNFEHEVILEDIPKSEADYTEKYLIKWYKLHDMSYNITDGGEGTHGVHNVISEERKKAISEFMKKNHPMKGKHHTLEAMAKIIAANRNRTYTPEQKAAMSEKARLFHTGRKASEESKKKMSEYKKAHPETWIGGWNKKEVHQYGIDGNYITTYKSAIEAAEKLGRKSGGDINNAANGKVESAFGYFWKYEKVDKIDISKYKITITNKGARIIDMSYEARMKRRAGHGKPVNQYSIDGEYIATYNSITDAAEKTKTNSRGITGCCTHKYRYKTANNYLWEYDNGDNRINIKGINNN